MSDQSRIEWTDATWNPVTGCSKVSPGCDNCYAERIQIRFGRSGPFDRTGDSVQLHPDRVREPIRWQKPRRVFVCSMADLFHTRVPDGFIDQVFGVMAATPQHQYQVLTKRPNRMRRWWGNRYGATDLVATAIWPPNVWAGTSVESQTYIGRVDELLSVPAPVRFVSFEPLICPVDIPRHMLAGLSWAIIGGESGRNARPMNLEWARRILYACQDAGVKVFVKQLGTHWAAHPVDARSNNLGAKGERMAGWPDDLRVREFPA